MKKLGLFIACAILATCAFAGEALPASAADWPAQLGMTPKMLFLVLQIGIIIFAAKIGGSIAGALKLPSVLGELGAGILIGPWALGGIPIPGFEGMFQHGLFYGHALRAQAAAGGNPFAATPELYGICTIASVVLLFLSGIETNLKMFLKYAFAGSLVGVGGVVFSFVLGIRDRIANASASSADDPFEKTELKALDPAAKTPARDAPRVLYVPLRGEMSARASSFPSGKGIAVQRGSSLPWPNRASIRRSSASSRCWTTSLFSRPSRSNSPCGCGSAFSARSMTP